MTGQGVGVGRGARGLPETGTSTVGRQPSERHALNCGLAASRMYGGRATKQGESQGCGSDLGKRHVANGWGGGGALPIRGVGGGALGGRSSQSVAGVLATAGKRGCSRVGGPGVSLSLWLALPFKDGKSAHCALICKYPSWKKGARAAAACGEAGGEEPGGDEVKGEEMRGGWPNRTSPSNGRALRPAPAAHNIKRWQLAAQGRRPPHAEAAAAGGGAVCRRGGRDAARQPPRSSTCFCYGAGSG